MVPIPKVDYHLVGFHFQFKKSKSSSNKKYPIDFLSIEFEHNLENEILSYSHQLAMRKIAITSYKISSHSNSSSSSSSSSVNKQPNLESSLHDENKSPVSPTKKFFWNKSNSKEG